MYKKLCIIAIPVLIVFTLAACGMSEASIEEDSEIQENTEIEKSAAQKYAYKECVNCGKDISGPMNVTYKLVDGDTYCLECYDNFEPTYCFSCGNTIEASAKNSYQKDGNYYCQSCYVDLFMRRYCADCGTRIYDLGTSYCKDCMEKRGANISNDATEKYKDTKTIDIDGKQIWQVYAASNTIHFTGSYKGTGNFIIKLLDSNQDFVALVVNEIGDYNVDKTISNLTKDNMYYIEIECSYGSWTCSWVGTYGT